MSKNKSGKDGFLSRFQDPDAEFGFAPGWRPVPGQGVAGKIVDFDISAPHPKYGSHPIMTLEVELERIPDAEGAVQVSTDRAGTLLAVHILHHVLDEKLRELGPTTGERIFVGRLEDGERKDDGESYKRYHVELDREDTGTGAKFSGYGELPEVDQEPVTGE